MMFRKYKSNSQMSSNTKESLTTCLVQYINFQRSRDLQLISSNIYDKFDQNIQSSKLEYMLEKFNFFLKRKAFDKLGICISKNKDNQQKRSKSCNLLYRDEAYQMNNILDLKKNLNITNSITMKSLNYSMTQKSKKQRDFIERQREIREKLISDHILSKSSRYTYNPRINIKSKEIKTNFQERQNNLLFNKAYKETLSTRKEDKNNFRKVDINRIERLYKDYKNRDLSRKKLEDKINKEQGITFKPEIGTANKKNYFSYRRYHIDETSDILNRYTDQNIRTSKILKYDCDFIGDSKVEDFSSLNTNNNILNLGLNSELLRNILNS